MGPGPTDWFLPGWVVGNGHVGVAGTVFVGKPGSGGGEKHGQCLPGCVNLVGTASGTAPRRGASAGQVAGLASAPPALYQRAAPPWHISSRGGWGRSWVVDAGLRDPCTASACEAPPGGVGRGRQGRLGILQRKHQAGSPGQRGRAPGGRASRRVKAANSTFRTEAAGMLLRPESPVDLGTDYVFLAPPV